MVAGDLEPLEELDGGVGHLGQVVGVALVVHVCDEQVALVASLEAAREVVDGEDVEELLGVDVARRPNGLLEERQGARRVVADALLVALLEGDANRDGVVSAGDYGSVQINFGDSGGTWDPLLFGDANMDGVVSAGDYSSVQINFGAGGGSVVTPEPATMLILLLGGAGLMKRRRAA